MRHWRMLHTVFPLKQHEATNNKSPCLMLHVDYCCQIACVTFRHDSTCRTVSPLSNSHPTELQLNWTVALMESCQTHATNIGNKIRMQQTSNTRKPVAHLQSGNTRKHVLDGYWIAATLFDTLNCVERWRMRSGNNNQHVACGKKTCCLSLRVASMERQCVACVNAACYALPKSSPSGIVPLGFDFLEESRFVTPDCSHPAPHLTVTRRWAPGPRVTAE
jgi:hypothetical protein